MSTRKELLNNLKEEMIKQNLWEENEDVFSLNYPFTPVELTCLDTVASDEQLLAMVDLLRTNKYKDAAEVLSSFKANGLLKFEPCFVPGQVPSLCLGWQRYLHLFRGYYYQISDTAEGVGEVYAGADRLDFALRSISYLSEDTVAVGSAFISIAALVPVLTYFDVGYSLLNSTLLDQFLTETAKATGLKISGYKDFSDYVTVEYRATKPTFPGDLSTNSEEPVAIRLMSEETCYGLLVISKETIQIVTRIKDNMYAITRLRIPGWFYQYGEDDELAIYDEDDRARLLSIMVRATLALAHFRADHTCMYAIGTKRGDVRRISYNVPNCAYKWSDINNYILDCVQ